MVTPVDDKQTRILFGELWITDYLVSRLHGYTDDLARWDPDDLLTRTPEDIADELLKRHGVESLKLLKPDAPADSVDRTINLDSRFSPFDTRRRQKVYRLAVPFTGDAELFRVRPSMHRNNPPAGHVDASRRRLTIEFAHLAGEAVEPAKVTQSFQRTMDNVNWYLDQVRAAVKDHNALIADLEPIQQRVAIIRAEREYLGKIQPPEVGDTQD